MESSVLGVTPERPSEPSSGYGRQQLKLEASIVYCGGLHNYQHCGSMSLE